MEGVFRCIVCQCPVFLRLFVPGVKAGASYQYEIKIKGGDVQRKSDPYGNRNQGAPSVISVVAELGEFLWQDEEWMKERERFASREVPVSIYETDVTEWKNSGELVEFLKETGYTHVEFHPVMEYLDDIQADILHHAYYALTTRFGTAADFRTLVDDLHQAGIGVILDWTPAQFPRFDAGWRNLTEHLFMKYRIRLWPFIRCGAPCFIITEALW